MNEISNHIATYVAVFFAIFYLHRYMTVYDMTTLWVKPKHFKYLSAYLRLL